MTSSRVDETAHPRSRGENRELSVGDFMGAGSSPLTRGKRPDADGGGGAQRLIPAHAGKTILMHAPAPYGAAHPRSRGENYQVPLF